VTEATEPDLPGRPSGHVVVTRRWTYAPPPRVMFEALVDDHGRWLPWAFDPEDEAPGVAVAVSRPEVVVFRPWVDPVVSAVEVRIEPDGGPGSALTILAYADRPELSEEETRRVRHRLGTAFGSALREWVDQPHG
jgi:hypothetical protein